MISEEELTKMLNKEVKIELEGQEELTAILDNWNKNYITFSKKIIKEPIIIKLINIERFKIKSIKLKFPLEKQKEEKPFEKKPFEKWEK